MNCSRECGKRIAKKTSCLQAVQAIRGATGYITHPRNLCPVFRKSISSHLPWSARVPLDPPAVNDFKPHPRKQADEGVGCRPGGLPHKLQGIGACATFGSAKMDQCANSRCSG